jgi:hypothetical protein
MLLGELEASFPWGLLVVTDSRSREQIPEWASNDQQVTLGETVAVLRVMHQDEGEVVVRVWDDLSAVTGDLAFRGSLKIESGLLTVADALGETSLEIPTSAGLIAIAIYTDAQTEPTEVDVVVTAAV